ncbi:MAG: phosphopyruvate hydratase [Candidatus Bathyarchaeia archaeon]|nr:phosphopyruvate hydratase [Candidatus Bathyarchaeota archaeon]
MKEEKYLIKKVNAREILDSRGNPTVEAEVITEGGFLGRASVPSGASTGKYEALELRDMDNSRFLGKGVSKAVLNVKTKISEALIGMDCRKQREIDEEMLKLDGTKNKSILGANAILSVSLANAKAAANAQGIPLHEHLGGVTAVTLPIPMMNIINGGKHAGNKLKIQEFLILPVGANSFKEALRIGVEVYYALKNILKNKYGRSAINVGDEGGFAPPMEKTNEALEAIIKAVEESGFKLNKEIWLGIDAAASNFYSEKDGKYYIDDKTLTPGELLDFYKELIKNYKVFSIEDPFQEEDFESFVQLTKNAGKNTQIVGDDLFVTNIERLSKGISMGAANALLMKVNQIGTLTEAIEAAELAFRNGYKVIVSHRSGETEDPIIADIAVGIKAQEIKTGAPARGERTAKYNQLLRIEEYLGDSAKYWGKILV